MSVNQPSINNLHEIKESLEQKINTSSDSDYSTDASTDTSTSSSHSKKKKNKKNKYHIYKLKYNHLESRIRYMQLDMVNKDIEIAELNNKLTIHNKNEILFTKINFLYERLDNAYKVLKDKMNSINEDKYIKLKTITELETIKESCKKVQEKYASYVNNDVYPLIDNIYLKSAIQSLYDIKQKELLELSNEIDYNIYNTKYYNSCWLTLFVLIIAIILQGIVLLFWLF